MGKKKKRKDVVYSTNPEFEYSFNEEMEEETSLPSDQHLYVYHDRKQRKGKTVTIVESQSVICPNLLFPQSKDICVDIGPGGVH